MSEKIVDSAQYMLGDVMCLYIFALNLCYSSASCMLMRLP